MRDIGNLFEQKEWDCYKPLRIGNLYSSIYIK